MDHLPEYRLLLPHVHHVNLAVLLNERPLSSLPPLSGQVMAQVHRDHPNHRLYAPQIWLTLETLQPSTQKHLSLGNFYRAYYSAQFNENMTLSEAEDEDLEDYLRRRSMVRPAVDLCHPDGAFVKPDEYDLPFGLMVVGGSIGDYIPHYAARPDPHLAAGLH